MVAVCIPSIGKSTLTGELVSVLRSEPEVNRIEIWDNSDGFYSQTPWEGVTVFCAPGASIYREWNAFARIWSERDDMLFLNDDIEMAPGTVGALREALTEVDLVSVASMPNRAHVGASRWVRRCTGTYRRNGICGWAFMVRKGKWPSGGIDERFKIWFGDDDLVHKIARTGVLEGVTVRHEESTTVNSIPNVDKLLAQDWNLWFKELGRK